jgi:NUMOD4 motif
MPRVLVTPGRDHLVSVGSMNIVEQWRDIPGYEGEYQVSDRGRIRNLGNRGRQITIELVRAAFKTRGLTLLETELQNARAHLRFICDKGHSHKINWMSFRTGTGCGICKGSFKHSFETVFNAFKEKGWTLLETEYVNAHTKMRFICDKGHAHKIRWHDFTAGKGCGVCAGRHKKVDEVFNAFQERGWTLIDTEYKGSQAPLKFRCSKGHDCSITWNNFTAGDGCGVCAGKHITTEDVAIAFRARGWELLEDEYVRSNILMRFRCNNGHEHKIALAPFNRGAGCGQCNPGGFSADLPGILYYIRFEYRNQYFYKIGVTNFSIKKRFKSEPIQYKIINEKHYLFGFLAHEEEQKMLKKYDKYRYKGKPFLIAGNTEIFTKDVLGLDKSVLSKNVA